MTESAIDSMTCDAANASTSGATNAMAQNGTLSRAPHFGQRIEAAPNPLTSVFKYFRDDLTKPLGSW